MKIKHWLLPLLAVVLVACAGIGAASAYFTTYVTAKGGYVIHLGDETEIHEEFDKGVKLVTITNKPGSSPVFVRVKGFAGKEIQDKLVYTGTDWIGPDADGFYRYQKALYGDERKNVSTQLTIEIPEMEVKNGSGDSFNVVVVYESVPAVFKADGTPDLETAWSMGPVTVIDERSGETA